MGSGDADEKTTTPTEPMNMTVLSVKEVADQEEVAGSTNPSAGDTPDSSENQLVQTGTGPRSEAAVTVVAAPPSEVEKAEELRAELKATTADKKKVPDSIPSRFFLRFQFVVGKEFCVRHRNTKEASRRCLLGSESSRPCRILSFVLGGGF